MVSTSGNEIPSMEEFNAWKSRVPQDQQKKLLAQVGYLGGGAQSMYDAYKKFMSPEQRGRRDGARQAAVDKNLAAYNQAFAQGKYWGSKR